MLEIFYKMFVPISFQVLPFFRLQIDIIAELLSILWFWPFNGAFICKISAQSAKYKKTRYSRNPKNVTFLFYFFEGKILGPNSAP
jgi:hypothetical protein